MITDFKLLSHIALSELLHTGGRFFFFGGNSSQRQVMKCAVSDKFITISSQRADQMLVTLTSRSHDDIHLHFL